MRFPACALLCASVLMMSCGTDDTTAIINLPPSITFNQTAIGFPRNGGHELSVTINDPDEDDILTTTWSITRGTLTPISGSWTTRMKWQAPFAVGRDTLRVTVSDGELTDRIEEEVLVGTVLSSLGGPINIAGSPYIIQSTGSPTIPVTNGTVIEAGVEILFDVVGGTMFVDGTVRAEGTDANPVIIRPNNRRLLCQDQRGWWEGFLVEAGGNLLLDYTVVTYGKYNVRIRLSGNATLTNSEFKCAEIAAVSMEGTGSLVIDSCVISNNQSVGVYLQSVADTVRITNSRIEINGDTGIRMSLNDPEVPTNILVKYNRIEFNSTHGVYLEGQVFPEIRFNDFVANGLSGGLSSIWLQRPYPGLVTFDTLRVDSNYWGGATSWDDIDKATHDSSDDSAIGTRIDPRPPRDTPFL
ncbi:MAG: right-handed parallel beta-helix repeat-containing protein [Candidatus Krumholzibacteriota bacterium]|nr:right-handed parallel beta-helix repeat-containing protein [Candidatus Krumholzibacteriota bacterium]